MTVHFLRVNKDGSLQKGYENDGLLLPTDVTGATEGQIVCRHWGARGAFDHTNRTTEFYQYTDTPTGTYWCSTQIGTASSEEFSITFGVPFADAKWFRGRETTNRATSRCPDGTCCRRPDAEVSERWSHKAWPSASCTRTSCPRCRPAPSPASTTPSCTRSWTLTRASDPPVGVVAGGRGAGLAQQRFRMLDRVLEGIREIDQRRRPDARHGSAGDLSGDDAGRHAVTGRQSQ